jgi:glycerol-3-phosphate dehydrogenase
MIYDVLVIGGGITGCMTAYRLSGYRLRIALAEAADDVAMGATKANSAIVHAGYDAVPGTLKAKYNVAGCAEMPALARLLDVPYNNCGSLVCAFSEEEVGALEELLERGEKNGVPGLAIVSGERARELEPTLSEKVCAALWAPTAGIVCSFELCIAAGESAARNGCDFYFNFTVDSIKQRDGYLTAYSRGSEISARYIVNAAGVNAAKIARLAGEEDFPVEIIPRRGEYALLDKSRGPRVGRVLFACPTERGKGILVSPTVHGNVIVGPNARQVETGDDTSTTGEGLEEVYEGGRRLVPAISPRDAITQFSGVRATPTTGDFYVRPSERVPGLLHLAGIESPGLASSPALSRAAVGLLGEMGLELVENPEADMSRPEKIRFKELDAGEKNALIARNPSFGRIVCRCETITEGEILDAIRRPIGARSLDMVKRRVRAGMGRCQGGFCSPRVVELLAEQLRIPLGEVTKKGCGSEISPREKRTDGE